MQAAPFSFRTGERNRLSQLLPSGKEIGTTLKITAFKRPEAPETHPSARILFIVHKRFDLVPCYLINYAAVKLPRTLTVSTIQRKVSPAPLFISSYLGTKVIFWRSILTLKLLLFLLVIWWKWVTVEARDVWKRGKSCYFSGQSKWWYQVKNMGHVI